ncbi:MAG: hypothetical protein CMF96_01560 [Candidatus Marinimicrobia bacterium]|nr:hypothetical protein [Candidatus Neomarinimicrobiota bacterium]|tara:strand:+ start:10265 stop:11488 length:1224 start_codon:yes stop_codon:yes gene_type:complete
MINIIFILFSFIFSQSSILSISGFGESNFYKNSASLGSGQIELFSTSPKSGSPSAIATIWRNRFTSVNVSNQFQNLNIYGYNFFTNGINLLSISFPISKDKAVQFSINPQYWSQYSLNENNQNEVFKFDGINYSYKSHYYGRGGFSNFSLVWSQRFNKKFEFGIRFDNYFGNKFQSDSTFTYNISLNSEGEDIISPNSMTITNSTHHYQGHGFEFSGNYIINNFFKLGFSYSRLGPLTISRKKYFTAGLIRSNKIIDNINILNQKYTFGLKYKLNDNFGIITEAKFKKWESVDSELLIMKSQHYNQDKYSLGSYYHLIESGDGFFSSFTIRSGLFLKIFKNLESADLIKDYGVTLGSSFRYNKNANSINVSVIFGKREYDKYSIQNEQYIDCVLGIEVGEKWFIRKK